MNHAAILTGDLRVISGLKNKKRQYEGQSASRKYPMILLSCNEKISDLGVTFGTTIAETLDDAHVEALRRLAPHFSNYQANYDLITELSSNRSGDAKTESADIRHPNERDECPWTRTREKRWHERTQMIYNTGRLASDVEDEEIIVTEHYNKFKAMQMASNQFDVVEARDAVVHMANELNEAQRLMFQIGPEVDERHKKQLEAAATARYAALAVQDLMTCVISSGSSEGDYFELTNKTLEASRMTLNTTG